MKKCTNPCPAGVFLGAFLLAPLWTSCQTQHHLVLEPVGPPLSAESSGPLSSVGMGYLRVYSATETRHIGHQTRYYPHTDYMIYDRAGKVVEWVENAIGPTDEAPAWVRLPAGYYTIHAEDDDYGRVTVPVVIQGGQTTAVHLEMRALSTPEQFNPTNLVRMPDGRIVGWHAAQSGQKSLP